MIRLIAATLTLFMLQPATPRPLRIIAFGAHPDDAELKASGVAALWAARDARIAEAAPNMVATTWSAEQ